MYCSPSKAVHAVAKDYCCMAMPRARRNSTQHLQHAAATTQQYVSPQCVPYSLYMPTAHSKASHISKQASRYTCTGDHLDVLNEKQKKSFTL
jgi:hypothetical protein